MVDCELLFELHWCTIGMAEPLSADEGSVDDNKRANALVLAR